MRYFIAKILFLLLFSVSFSCKKAVPTGGSVPAINLLQADLYDGPWRFTSATITYPSGAQTRYVGTNLDSVIFYYGDNGGGSVVPTSMSSIINGVASNCYWTLNKDSTIVFTPTWRDGLSDTVLCKSFSDYLLVLSVKHTTNIGVGTEIDSLKKIRFWNH